MTSVGQRLEEKKEFSVPQWLTESKESSVPEHNQNGYPDYSRWQESNPITNGPTIAVQQPSAQKTQKQIDERERNHNVMAFENTPSPISEANLIRAYEQNGMVNFVYQSRTFPTPQWGLNPNASEFHPMPRGPPICCRCGSTGITEIDNHNKNNAGMLTAGQMARLEVVMNSTIYIHPPMVDEHMPFIKTSPIAFIRKVREKISQRKLGIRVLSISLVGGAARFVLHCGHCREYNDIDVVIDVDFGDVTYVKGMFDQIYEMVLSSIKESIPSDGVEAWKYVEKKFYKNVDTRNDDVWSLISLRNYRGRNLDLKFVKKMKRRYEFPIDSFLIDLQPLIGAQKLIRSDRLSAVRLSSSYPGGLETALTQFKQKQVEIISPEEVRGGGLLKYCSLISTHPSEPNRGGYQLLPFQRDYRLHWEGRMITQYLMTFLDDASRLRNLESYLNSHFHTEIRCAQVFLENLERIVKPAPFAQHFDYQIRVLLEATNKERGFQFQHGFRSIIFKDLHLYVMGFDVKTQNTNSQ